RRTILHQFDRLEQTAPSDVADVTVIAEPLGEPPLQVPAEFLDLVEHLLFADHALHFQSRRAGHRVSKIGMSVLKGAGAWPDGHDDFSAREHRADRLVAAAQSL